MRQKDPSGGDGMLVAVLGSMTSALHASRVLSAAAVRTQIVKSDSEAERGCGFGVLFAASQRTNVRAILTSAHINVRRYADHTAWESI